MRKSFSTSPDDDRAKKHEAKIEALRVALVEGEESGPSTPFDFEAFIARKSRAPH
jgi:antitoxin ParD1/3/4